LWKADHDIRDNYTIVLKGLGIIKRMKPFVTESVLQIIYKSNVHAVILNYFDYSYTVWNNTAMLLLSWETEQNTELGGKNFNRDLTVMMFLQNIYCAITIGKRWKSVHGIKK
jgi:hypothetical protein